MGGVRQRAMTTTLPKLIQSLRKECPKPRIKQLPSLRRAFSLYDQINLIDNVPEDQLRFLGYTDTGFRVNGVEYEGSLLCVGNLLTSWAPSSFSQITPDRSHLFSSLPFFSPFLVYPSFKLCGLYQRLMTHNEQAIQDKKNVGSLVPNISLAEDGRSHRVVLVLIDFVVGFLKDDGMNVVMMVVDMFTKFIIQRYEMLSQVEILILGCGRYTQPVDPELRRFIRSTGMKLEAVDSRNAASTYNILNEEGRSVAAALLPYGVSS
ncbi:hypothetical protein POTOM_048794 [Populus tomentosa]|uniref:NADH dehydrogenase [ubiquinone] 1 alpha subcomplex assembly factor 3 n=1 Tax=Populus tomentosa TaxID=118781 RepID=A0A8X7YFW4_POPTO|nr:hypothetical protein POTOM_048794 [Populus tomentosa]